MLKNSPQGCQLYILTLFRNGVKLEWLQTHY